MRSNVPGKAAAAIRRLAVALLAVAAALTTLAGSPVAAQASATSCIWNDFYTIPSKTSYHLPAAGTHFKDGPGGTMTVSVATATTVSASASVTAGASVSGIIAQAKIEVSASVTKSTAITVGHTYTHPITAGRYGNMEYGSWGYNVSWRYYYRLENCTNSLRSSGTAKVPTTDVGWRYWETT